MERTGEPLNPSPPSQSHQLAAIMFTDIAGYTTLMEEDEDQAFQLLEKNRLLQRPIIEKYNGKWLKEMGDGILASFTTISEAVYCAKEIINATQKEPNLNLRIGIHQGEVIFKDGDVFGSGVNIASRIEELAPRDCILISEPVYRNIANRKDIETEFVGEEQLKHVKEAVKIYKVKAEAPEDIPKTSALVTPQAPESKPTSRKIFKLLKTGLTSLAALVILGLAYMIYNSSPNPAESTGTEPQILDKSIAVLPFANMSGDPEQEALCDGLTEEIIHHLSLIKSFDKVISRSSVMSFKNTDKTLIEIAGHLKVDIVLEGSFRQSGDQIKITAQLIDAVNDNHLWSEIYERPFGDIFEIQSDIAKKIAARFKAEVTKEEEIRLDKKPTKSIEAYILLSKASYKVRLPEGADWKSALDLMKKAVEIDPGFAEGYAALAGTYLSAEIGFYGDKSIPIEDPLLLAQKALALDPELSRAYSTLGMIYSRKEWNFPEAEKAFRKAVELDLKNSYSLWRYAELLVEMGRAAEALPYQQKAVEVAPINPVMLNQLAKFYFFAGKNDKAAEIMEEYETLFPNEFPALMGQEYLYLGRLEKALESFEKGNVILNNDRTVPMFVSLQAIAYTKNGQKQKAQPLVDRLKQMSREKVAGSPEYSVGYYYSGTGQKEEALRWLEKAYVSHDTELIWLKTEPMFEILHDDPRYEDLLRRIGFPE